MAKNDTATIEEPPVTQVVDDPTGGNAFAAKLAEAEEKAGHEIETVPEPEKIESTKEPAKEPEKEPAKAVKGKTPLDTAPVVPKDEPKPIENELAELLKSEPPANASASSKANHAAMRKGLEKANARIEELKTKYEAEKSKPAAAPEEYQQKLDKAIADLKERDAVLERVAFDRSPRVLAFNKAESDELTAAKSYVEGSELDPNVIELASRSSGANRVRILAESGMDANLIAVISPHLARIDAINRERASAAENHKASLSEWESEQKAVQEKRTLAARANEDRVFDEGLKKLSTTFLPAQSVEGNEEWNTDLSARNQRAKDAFDGKLPLPETIEILQEGVHAKLLHESYTELRTKYNEAMAEIGRLTSAGPGAANGKADTTLTQDNVKDPLKMASADFGRLLSAR